jgi:hypothetical protein
MKEISDTVVEAASQIAGMLMKEKTDAGYDIEIPSLGVVIRGDKKLLTYNPIGDTSENYREKK